MSNPSKMSPLACYFTTLLAALAGASAVPQQDVHVAYPRRSEVERYAPLIVERAPEVHQIQRRDDLNATYDLSWEANNHPLFSAKWTGGTGNIPIIIPGVPVPLTSSATGNFELTLECLECRTTGNIVADINDDDPLNPVATLTFNNVGVHLDLSVLSASGGTYTIGIGANVGTNSSGAQNIVGKTFSANVGLSLDLVFQFDGPISASGGFEVSIPDGTTVGLNIDLDITTDGFNATSNILSFPKPNVGLLPLFAQAAANFSVALVLKADAAISAKIPSLTEGLPTIAAGVGAGAHLTLVEVKFGAVATSNNTACPVALFIDVDANAGAYATAAASLGEHGTALAPAASTTFFHAGTTTCLGAGRPSFRATGTPTITAGAGAGGGCGGAAVAAPTPLVTTSTYALTSCVVPLKDCPASLTQVVLVTNVETVLAAQCAATTAGGNGTRPAGTGFYPGRTGTATSAVTVTAPSLTMTPLATPATGDGGAGAILRNATAPVNATVPGSFQPVKPTSNATVPVLVNGTPARGAVGACTFALVGLVLGAVVLL